MCAHQCRCPSSLSPKIPSGLSFQRLQHVVCVCGARASTLHAARTTRSCETARTPPFWPVVYRANAPPRSAQLVAMGVGVWLESQKKHDSTGDQHISRYIVTTPYIDIFVLSIICMCTSPIGTHAYTPLAAWRKLFSDPRVCMLFALGPRVSVCPMDDDPDFDFIVGLAAPPEAPPGEALVPAPDGVEAQGDEAFALALADPESEDLRELAELAAAPAGRPRRQYEQRGWALLEKGTTVQSAEAF